MLPQGLKRGRERYAYPCLVLRGGRPHKLRTTSSLDGYHSALLNSQITAKKVNGVLSVIFWGHSSGQDGTLKVNYALTKVRRAIEGENFSNVAVASIVSNSAQLIRRRRYGQAVRCLTSIPQLGFAFASKVCAFLSGDDCGVVDSVIAERYPGFGFDVDDNGYLRNNRLNAESYDKYCRFLRQQAAKLNDMGARLNWRDRDRIRYLWRAVDVERALYS